MFALILNWRKLKLVNSSYLINVSLITTYKSKGNISVSMVTEITWQNTKKVDYGALVTELVVNNTLLLHKY